MGRNLYKCFCSKVSAFTWPWHPLSSCRVSLYEKCICYLYTEDVLSQVSKYLFKIKLFVIFWGVFYISLFVVKFSLDLSKGQIQEIVTRRVWRYQRGNQNPNRQHNGQKKKHKMTNNDLQNIHIKLKIE